MRRGLVPFLNGMLRYDMVFRPLEDDDLVTAANQLQYGWVPPSPQDVQEVREFYKKILPVADEREVVMQLSGAALAGHTGKYFMVWSDERAGNNGKSTLMKLQKGVFSSTKAPAKKTYLIQATSNDPEAHSATTLAYKSKRIAFFDEWLSKEKIDSAKLKDYASGVCTVAVRKMRSEEVVEFPWTSLVVLLCNEGCLPEVPAGDTAWLDRLITIKFRAKFCKTL